MKTLLIKYFAVCMLICTLFAGCVDLDVYPTNKFTDDIYWTTEERAASVLHMAYRQMNGAGDIFRNERLSDNLYNGYGGDDVKRITSGQALSSTPLFESLWGDWYAGIKTTHTFLANVHRVGMHPDLEERMKAEARFIRAFLFFQLTNWYGNVPFFTQDINLETAQTISPTSQAEIVAWIHQELEEVAEILPTREQYDEKDRGRITAGAAMAFNARVALNFNDYARVKQYTDKLINTTAYGQYSLFPNYQELFYKANEYNAEIILDIQYVPVVRIWGEISTYVPFNLQGVQYIQACPTQDLVDSYLMKDGSKWVESNPPAAYNNRDPRMDMTIVRQGSTVYRKDNTSYMVNVNPNSPGMSTTNDRLGRENGSQTGYFYRKFYDPSSAAWTPGKEWDCNINFVTLRYADVLLMYAEAMFELGEMNASVWDITIKKLRERAGFDNTPAAMDYPGAVADLQDIIRNERRVELALEGTRIYDIRRWKIAEIVMNQPVRGAKYKTGGTEYYSYSEYSFNRNRDYLWAIPRKEFLINPNLGQNPGY